MLRSVSVANEAVRHWWKTRLPVVGRSLEIAGLLVLPILFEAILLGTAWRRGTLGIDIDVGLLPQAEAIRDGVSPFVGQHYPPLLPVLLVPFTYVPSASVVVAALAAVAVATTLWALEIRDWRCYGAAFLWPSVFSGIQTANATLFLVCLTALAWRFRDRGRGSSLAVGIAVGAKLISWPLAAWLAATGRVRTALWGIGLALVLSIGLGALLEVTLGQTATVAEFGSVATTASTPSYSVLDVGRSLGAPTWAGAVALACLTLALAVVSVVVARRGDDLRSFAVACLACLVAAPNVWLHSFCFLLPVMALLRPRFSGAWLVPVLLVVVPVVDPSPAEIAIAWSVTGALTLWLLIPPSFGGTQRVVPQAASPPRR